MNREEYVATGGFPAHRAYYAQFVNAGVLALVGRHIGVERIKASTDPYLNDIPLKEWDALHLRLPLAPGVFLKYTGSNSYSLSDSVCIAKEAARQIKEAS